MSTHLNRRAFFKTTAMLGAGLSLPALPACAAGTTTVTPTVDTRKRITLAPNDVVLFIGDSITDARRNRRKSASIPNEFTAMGLGYAAYAASNLLLQYPEKTLSCFNRGYSGFKLPDLANSWKENCISLKPNVLSILIGVNDYWNTVHFGAKYKGTAETYESGFRELLERTRKALPNVKIIICEPFVLNVKGKDTATQEAVNDSWFPAFNGYRTAARKIADEFDTAFIPFQTTFDEALKRAPAKYWAEDGVHPTLPGNRLMADVWLQAVR